MNLCFVSQDAESPPDQNSIIKDIQGEASPNGKQDSSDRYTVLFLCPTPAPHHEVWVIQVAERDYERQ